MSRQKLDAQKLNEAILRQMGIVVPRKPKYVPDKREMAKRGIPKRELKRELVFDATKIKPFFPRKLSDRIKKNLTFAKNYEVEASLGLFKNRRFTPGLNSAMAFSELQKLLESSKDFKVETSRDLVTIANKIHYDGKVLNTVRRIVDRDLLDEGDVANAIKYEMKTQIKDTTVDNWEWGYRVRVAREEILDEKLFDSKFLKNFDSYSDILRIRTRTSFLTKNKNSPFRHLRIDLTYVEETNLKRGSNVRIHYEVELERIGKVDIESFEEALWLLLSWSQNVKNPKNTRYVLSLPEKSYAIAKHNSFFLKEVRNPKLAMRMSKDPFLIFKDYWNKPVPLKLREMINPKFDPAITVKYDGTRRFLLIDSEGIYFFAPPKEVKRIGNGNKEFSGTFIDGEYMPETNEYFAFDILFFKGRDVRVSNFFERQSLLKTVKNPRPFNIKYKLKKYFMKHLMSFQEKKMLTIAKKDSVSKSQKEITTLKSSLRKAKRSEKKEIKKRIKALEKSIAKELKLIEKFSGIGKEGFYENSRDSIERMRELEKNREGSTDGLIYQSLGRYKNKYTYKWKPLHLITIDFQLIPKMDEKGNIEKDVFLTYVSKFERGKVVMVPFFGNKKSPFDGEITIKGGEIDGSPVSNAIVECRWDFDKDALVALRIRFDRDKPNRMLVANSNWMDMHNPIYEETLEGETLQVARIYFNDYKKLLIEKYAKGKVILDIGSGRGGDMMKWNNAGVKKVFSVEPNKENRTELKRRRDNMKLTTKVIVIPAKAQNTEKITKKVKKVDGVVSFFSLTFFFKSVKIFDGLIETIDSVVESGGFFMGIVLDGERTRMFLEDFKVEEDIPEDEGVVYENSAFSIEQASIFSEDIENNPFGDEIVIDIVDSDVMVKEQTEWLVYFEILKKELSSKGFTLERTDFLDKNSIYQQLPEDSKVFADFQRMFVFRKN